MDNIITQIIGFLGLGALIFSFHIRSQKGFIFCQSTGNALFCLQYFLLGGMSGCITAGITVVRNYQIIKKEGNKVLDNKVWMIAYIMLDAVITVLTWSGLRSMLPFIAFAFGTTMYWSNNAQRVRLANLCICCPSWLIYDVVTHSIGGIVSETITILSILLAILGIEDNDGDIDAEMLIKAMQIKDPMKKEGSKG